MQLHITVHQSLAEKQCHVLPDYRKPPLTAIKFSHVVFVPELLVSACVSITAAIAHLSTLCTDLILNSFSELHL